MHGYSHTQHYKKLLIKNLQQKQSLKSQVYISKMHSLHQDI